MRRPANKFVLRGYIKREDDHYVAVCIDLNIAAQGKTPKEAQKECENLIREYIDYICETYPNEFEKYIYRPAPQEFIKEYLEILKANMNNDLKENKKAGNFEKWLNNFSFKPQELAHCSV